MSKKFLRARLGLGLLLVASMAPSIVASAGSMEPSASRDATGVIQAVNALRSRNGLTAYSVNSILMGTAQAQAEYMASTGTWGHTGPGGSTVTQRLLAAGYPLAGDLSLGGFRSENVVMGTGMTADEAVAAWTMDSIHLHTMLSTDLQEIGAGVAERDGTLYYVIDCARPTSSGAPQAYTPGAEAAYSAALDQIIVPVSVSTPDSSGNLVHEVRPGQSLWQIAIEYGVKIDDIRKLNQLPTAYLINPGDKLLVKKVGTPTPPPPSQTPTSSPPPTLPSATHSDPSPAATKSSTPPAPAAPGVTGAGGAVGAIIVVALAAAGLVAWAARSRPI